MFKDREEIPRNESPLQLLADKYNHLGALRDLGTFNPKLPYVLESMSDDECRVFNNAISTDISFRIRVSQLDDKLYKINHYDGKDPLQLTTLYNGAIELLRVGDPVVSPSLISNVASLSHEDRQSALREALGLKVQ
jgi:hypothetical protein